MITQELSIDELKDYEQAFLEKLSDSEIAVLNLPSMPVNGQGWCEKGKCYTYCGYAWNKLVDGNGNQYSCAQGRGMWYSCGSRQYLATC